MKEEPFEVIEHEGLTVEIHADPDAESPDMWGDDGLFLLANHREFYVRGKELTEDKVKEMEETHHVFAIEAYIHSGVCLHLINEAMIDRMWDVSPVGFAFATKKEWETREAAEKSVRSLIETWNQYLEGDVWGYAIKDKDEKHLDSCRGFYGLDSCKSEAMGIAGAIAKKNKKERETKTKAMIKNRVPLKARVEILA